MRRKFLNSTLAVLMLLVILIGTNSASAAGDSYTVSQSFPISLVVFVPCAAGGVGEDVELTGNLHDLFHFSSDAAVGLHLSIVSNPQGVTGTGLTTGDKYQGTGITRSQLNTMPGYTDTQINNFRIIGQGSNNNFLLHDNFHITVNANGMITTFHDNFSVECM